MSKDADLQKALQRGVDLLNELAAFNPEDNDDLSHDVFCIKLASKARALPHSDIASNEHLQAILEMGIEAAFRLGRRSARSDAGGSTPE